MINKILNLIIFYFIVKNNNEFYKLKSNINLEIEDLNKEHEKLRNSSNAGDSIRADILRSRIISKQRELKDIQSAHSESQRWFRSSD